MVAVHGHEDRIILYRSQLEKFEKAEAEASTSRQTEWTNPKPMLMEELNQQQRKRKKKKGGCICLLLRSPSRAFSPTSVHWRCLSGTSEDTFLIACYLPSGFPLPLNIWPRPGRSVAGGSLQMFPSPQPPRFSGVWFTWMSNLCCSCRAARPHLYNDGLNGRAPLLLTRWPALCGHTCTS